MSRVPVKPRTEVDFGGETSEERHNGTLLNCLHMLRDKTSLRLNYKLLAVLLSFPKMMIMR